MTGTGRMTRDEFVTVAVRLSRIATVVILSLTLRVGLGHAQDLTRARTAVAGRDFGAALSLLQEAVQQSPTDPEARYLLGLALKGLGRGEEAMTEFQEALRLKSKYPEARLEVGLFQLEKGQRSEAEATLRKGIEQQAKPLGPLFYGMGLVKIASDSLGVAETWLIKASMDDPQRGAYHKVLGDINARKGVTERAIEEYNRALETDPKSPDLHYAIGKLYFKEKKWPEVIKAWSDAVAADSTFAPVYKDLSNLYLIMKPPRYEEAVPSLQKAVQFNPDDAKLSVELARAMAKTSTYRSQALPYLEKAARLAPQDAEVFVLIGDIAHASRDYPRAIQAFQSAVKIDPALVGALKGLAEVQKASGDTAAAIATLQQVAEQDTSEGGLVEGQLGLLLYNQGRYDEAIPNLKEQLKNSPKVSLLYRLLGLSYIKKGNYAAVLTDVKPMLDSAVTTYPDDARKLAIVYTDLGMELYRAKRYNDAIDLFQKKIQIEPENWGAHLNLGYAYLAQKAYPRAIESLRKVVQYKPDHAQAYYLLGACYAESKSGDQAKSAFMKVIDLDPKNVDALKQVGLAYLLEAQSLQKADKHKESQRVAGQAAGYVQRAVGQKPGDVQARVLLAQAYVLSKQLDKAKEEFRRVLKMDPNNKDAQQGLERLEGGP